ncbi:MAG TPA: anti-sigma factor [Acidobacteriaceae bacterium]|jgi:anti-sigma-K factor RskA|nr:anti-sigma factor [Acidobacteriaceae bacterium]
MDRHINSEDLDFYALGAIEGEEKQELEAHLRACNACTRELEAAQGRVALLAFAAPSATPSPAVKEGLMRRVRQERAQQMPRPVPSVRRSGWWTPALAAAAVIFAVIASWLWARDQAEVRQIHSLEAQLTAARERSIGILTAQQATGEILGEPETLHVALAQQPDGPPGRAGVLYNPRSGAVVYAGQLPKAPADKSYQLWLVPASGAPLSLGVFSAEEQTTFLTARVPAGLAAKAFAVTVEPKGGEPQPTGPKVLVGAGAT